MRLHAARAPAHTQSRVRRVPHFSRRANADDAEVQEERESFVSPNDWADWDEMVGPGGLSAREATALEAAQTPSLDAYAACGASESDFDDSP